MTFDEWDFGENFLKKSINEMTPEDLLIYSYEMFRETFEYRLVLDYVKDRAVMRWFRKTYGKDAGPMLKWYFYQYKGSFQGEQFAVNQFQSGHKWWIDKLYNDLKNKSRPTVKRPSTMKVGFMSVRDLKVGV